MMNGNKTTATQFFDREQALRELDSLTFAYQSLELFFPKGSCEMEIFNNASNGFRKRIDYLHDSFRRLLQEQATKAAVQMSRAQVAEAEAERLQRRVIV